MSRDFTPKETYFAYQRLAEKRNTTFFPYMVSVMESMTVTVDGETRPVYSPQEIAHCKEYPLFGMLLNNFDALYQKLSHVDGGLALLARHEEALAEYIETGRGDTDSFVVNWFEGKLDKAFYYCERNQEFFEEALLEEAHALRKAPLNEKIQDAETRVSEQGLSSAQHDRDPEAERCFSRSLQVTCK